MKKSTINYFVDLIIGLAFFVSAISGLVFLVPLEWLNYSSGSIPTILGLNFNLWDTLHILSSLGLIGGVAVHVVLHWSWIINKTRKLASKPVALPVKPIPVIQSKKPEISSN